MDHKCYWHNLANQHQPNRQENRAQSILTSHGLHNVPSKLIKVYRHFFFQERFSSCAGSNFSTGAVLNKFEVRKYNAGTGRTRLTCKHGNLTSLIIIYLFEKVFWSKQHSLKEFTYRVRWESSLMPIFHFDPDSLLVLHKDSLANTLFSAFYHFFIFN